MRNVTVALAIAAGGSLFSCGGSRVHDPEEGPRPEVVVAPSPAREEGREAGRQVAGPAAPSSDASRPAPAAIAANARECEPYADLTERRERDLTVPVEPRPIDPNFFGRLRHHASGTLTLGSPRVWFGPRVPRFVPLYEGSSELHLLEEDESGGAPGFVAVYRDPYGAGSCDVPGDANCRVLIVGYEHCGKRKWAHDLRGFMSRPTHLEVQDVRVAGGTIYFNEACQSYSREVGGRCSALVALDPVSGQALWRTKPLVSNNRLLVVGDYVVAGYGFTAEPDNVSLVRRRDGAVTSRARLESAHEDLVIEGGNLLVVRTYPGDRFERFRLSGLDGDAAKLTRAR